MGGGQVLIQSLDNFLVPFANVIVYTFTSFNSDGHVTCILNLFSQTIDFKYEHPCAECIVSIK